MSLIGAGEHHAELDIRTEFGALVASAVLDLKGERLAFHMGRQQRRGVFTCYMPWTARV